MTRCQSSCACVFWMITQSHSTIIQTTLRTTIQVVKRTSRVYAVQDSGSLTTGCFVIGVCSQVAVVVEASTDCSSSSHSNSTRKLSSKERPFLPLPLRTVLHSQELAPPAPPLPYSCTGNSNTTSLLVSFLYTKEKVSSLVSTFTCFFLDIFSVVSSSVHVC
jgi:hypothetical protein